MKTNQIIQGNALEELKKLPDNSVDLILTDPPYLKEFVHYYKILAKEGKRILKKGGFLFAYCGVEFLPRIIKDMGKYLTWFWLFEIKHNGPKPKMWNKKLFIGCKPVVIFTKGKPKKEFKWANNLYTGDKRDKGFHKWGQSIFFPLWIIERYTVKGDLVLDPFVGGGNIILASKLLDRNFLGFEIEEKFVRIANKRLEQTNLNDWGTLKTKL